MLKQYSPPPGCCTNVVKEGRSADTFLRWWLIPKPTPHHLPKYINGTIIFSVPAGYERPSVQSSASGSSNGLSQSGSLMFAAGASYENPNGVGFYENPLAAPKAPTRNDSLERHPGDLLDSSLYDNLSSPTSASGNE